MQRLLSLFRKPSAIILARKELEQAQRDLLDAQTGYEYAKRIADYNSDRIKRLTIYIREAHKEETP